MTVGAREPERPGVAAPAPGRGARARARYVLPLIALLLAAALGYGSMRALRAEPESAVRDVDAPREPALRARAEPMQPEGGPAQPAASLDRRRLHPRDPREWQGMRMVMNNPAFCERSAGCGLAKACRDGRCGPCTQASDCATGEVCVLDHCLRAELASCTSRSECAPNEMCILDGYTGGTTRNNERMRSLCLAGVGGVEQREGEQASAIGPPEGVGLLEGPRSKLDVDALQRQVQVDIVHDEGSGPRGLER